MRCPSCGADDDCVVDSRPTARGEAVRRRRECSGCGGRFTTFERVELPRLRVRKRSGAVVPFDRGKVREGIARAAKGRGIPDELVEHAVASVESAVRTHGSEVTSELVGLSVLSQLREIDEVAYVRFASVYKDFQGSEDFEKELHSLRKDVPPKDLAPTDVPRKDVAPTDVAPSG